MLRKIFQLPLLGALILVIPSCSKMKDDDADRRATPTSMPITTNGTVTGREIPATGPEMTFQKPIVTNLQQILSTQDLAALQTRQVDLRGVRIQRVLNSQYVLLGPEQGKGVLVRLKELLPNLKPGQTLDVSGIIDQLGKDLSHWELDPENKKLLSDHVVFINANRSGVSGER